MAAPTGRPASSGKGVAVQGLKLPFHVTFASSFDDGYDPTQLEQPTPTAKTNNQAESKQSAPTPHIKGWQSAKYCPYPQHLVLKFPGYFDIRKIQILSHQAKIANTIEIHAGASPSLTDHDDTHAQYTRLGYLSLDSNERSGFKARELKSVYVNARGNFLRLTIKKCYANQINQFNQVGIIAINVVGTQATTGTAVPQLMGPAGGAADASAGGHPSSSSSSSGSSASANSNVIHSLMSQYNCDEKTAEKIFDLEKSKSRAIAAEDYDEAKRLKVRLDSLKQLGGQLAMLEKQKIAAVAREDYDVAKQIKLEIDYLRSGKAGRDASGSHHPAAAQQQRGPDPRSLSRAPSQQLVGNRRAQEQYADEVQRQEQGGHTHHQHQGSYGGHPQHSQPHQEQEDGYEAAADPRQAAGAQHREAPYDMESAGASAPPQPSAEDEYQGDPEDRPIRPSRNAPAAGGGTMGDEDVSRQPAASLAGAMASHQASPYEQPDPYEHEDGTGGSGSSGVPAPEPLNAVNRKEAEPLFDVFGEHTMMCLYSRHWQLRQQSLKDITQSVLSNSSDLPVKELFGASCRVLRRGLSDKVSQIFLSACQFLQVLLQHVSPRLKPEEVKANLDPIVHAMMDKLSSSNVRERDGGMQVLCFLALSSHVHPSLVPANLLQPLKKKEKDSPLPLKMRAKILLKCLTYYGLEDGFSLGLSALTKFVLPHLLHRDAGVREGMFNLVAGMSSVVGVQRLMPAFKELRPQTLESLQGKLEDVSNGTILFLKPTQPRLDQPYISENDPTHTVNGVPATSLGAGVSAPQPAPTPATAPAAAPPTKQKQPQAAQQQQQQQGGDKQQGGPPKAGGGGGSANGGGQKKQSQQNHTPHQQQPQAHAAIAEEESIDLQGKCQFCGLEDPSFTEEKLDLHYWQSCPLLISCKACEQVVEIPTLNDHLLQECEVQGGYKQCPTCGEAILASSYAQHVDRQDCQPPAPGMNRCALCHADIPDGEEGWRQHLLVDMCPYARNGSMGTTPVAPR